MGIITKEVEVRPRGKMIQYYKDKGYDAKYNQPLIVCVDDLPKGSHTDIEVLCDMCKHNKITVSYEVYNRVVKNTGSYVCQHCLNEKRMNTNKKKYGVYVASQSDIFKEKTRKTNLERYGAENVMRSSQIKERLQQSNLCKYGVLCTLQVPEVKEKVLQSYYKNGTQKTSKQQLYLHSLYGGEINYPISYYATDICFPEEKLVIEYDGGGHDLRVTLGRLTQEEFNQKEIIRNNIIKREGYKQMRIISTKDLLPSDTILLQMLTQAKEYFLNYPEHSWIEYNIDSSSIRSAEQKDGVFFDYGDLRRIKEIA